MVFKNHKSCMEQIVTHHFPKEDLLLLLAVIISAAHLVSNVSKLKRSCLIQNQPLGCVMLCLYEHLFHLKVLRVNTNIILTTTDMLIIESTGID